MTILRDGQMGGADPSNKACSTPSASYLGRVLATQRVSFLDFNLATTAHFDTKLPVDTSEREQQRRAARVANGPFR